MEGKKRMSGDIENFGRRRKGQGEIGKDVYGRTGRNVTVRGRREGQAPVPGRGGDKPALPQALPPLYTLPASSWGVQVPSSANRRGEGQAISQ